MLETRDFSEAIAGQRTFLYRLAYNQLQDHAEADDVVQNTILAALAGQRQFEQRSSLKTWLLSILRFKILDCLRDRQKRRAHCALPFEISESDLDIDDFDALFDTNGCWTDTKDVWTNPETVAERSAFLKVLEACLTRLPEKTSRVFLMREWLDDEPEQICERLGITPGNLRVLLYRARMQLRLCLDLNWER